MSRLAATLLALASLWGAAASAGDNTSWTFTVLEVRQVVADRVLVRLKPTPPGKGFPRSCDVLTIHSQFDQAHLYGDFARRITRADHLKAIRALLQARITGEILRVGSIDTGFGAIPNLPRCEVASRSFNLLIEEDGVPAVYSFY